MIKDLSIPKSNPIVGAVKAKNKEVKEEKTPLNESNPGPFRYFNCILLHDKVYFNLLHF